MTDTKTPDELPKDLISDADFVALIEAEMKDAEAHSPGADDIAQKRLWHKLQASTAESATQPQPTRKLWPWALVAALCLGLWPLLQKKDEDQFKGGTSSTTASGLSLSVTADKDAYTISYNGSAMGFLALVEDREPYDVLWLRNGPSGNWTVPKTEVRDGRVCAIPGQDIGDITKKINIVRELKQIPADAPCLTFPQRPE